MPNITLRDVQVDFPFSPYPCQEAYMEKVIECLQKSKNGILESPTGTGKTLCLLCSALAWLDTAKAQAQLQRNALTDAANSEFYGSLDQQMKEASGTWAGGNFTAIPKIIYASRTHSQLSQAIQELKRTKYGKYVKVGILGSRDQMCIHPQVAKEESNTSKVNLCRAKVNAKTCNLFNNLDSKKNHPDFHAVGEGHKILDIEDLVLLGEKHRVCPYYMAKELKTEAEIVFMPYNYLLDQKARKAHGIELQGNVLIFDEAHNLERICEESSSFDLSSYDLSSATEELQAVADKMMALHDAEKEQESAFGQGETTEIIPDLNGEDVLRLKSQLLDLESAIYGLEVPKDKGLTKAGVFIFELLGSVYINFETKNNILTVIEKIVAHLNSDASVGFHSRGAALSKIADVLKIVFSREPMENQTMFNHKATLAKYYKVHIKEEEDKRKKKTLDVWASSSNKEKKGRTLSYWCFSPGYSMNDLVDHQIKCIILTSGTLAPLDSFTAEMQIEFPVTLENPHVIQEHQFMVGTFCQGPDTTTLNSSYQTRFNESYLASLGNAVVNFARVVPNGLLIFFPSYPLMNKTLEYWQEANIWNRITQYKPIFIEPKGKQAFNEAMEDFYSKINDPTLNGAIFAAVCRGKVSEGLDFSDINGRAVVITGLPFPPMMDARVKLKMGFLDEMQNKMTIKGLSGNSWYKQQAYRAVNQAIGRVIRHKDDYGAILLCDCRFKSEQSVSQLPSWIQPKVKVFDVFGKGMKDLLMFFKTAEKLLPTPQPKAAKSKSETLGCAGASFMDSNVRYGTSKLRAEPSSRVVSHVPSLKQDDLSLAKLKVQYESTSQMRPRPTSSKGLLNALDHTEVQNWDSDDDTTSQLPSNQSDLQQRLANRQKKKIKLKCRPREDGLGVSVTLTRAEEEQLPNARAYTMQIKQILGAASYKTFADTMSDYTKRADFNTLVTNLSALLTEEPRNHHLFRKFYRFVKPQHKAQFDQVCKDITGQGCGYRPEDSIRKKRTQDGKNESQEKKRKLDPQSSMTHGDSTIQINTGVTTTSYDYTGTKTSSLMNTGTKTASLMNTGTKTASHMNTGTRTASHMNTETKTASHMNTETKLAASTTSFGGSSIHMDSSTHLNKGLISSNIVISNMEKGTEYDLRKESKNMAAVESQLIKCNRPHDSDPNKEDKNVCESVVRKSGNHVSWTDSKLGSDIDEKDVSNSGSKCVGEVQNQHSSSMENNGQCSKITPDATSCDANDKTFAHKLESGKTTVDPSVANHLGYTCCICKQSAKIPLESPCEHVACFLCWKKALQNLRQCPECSHAPLKPKHLKRLFFSNPDQNK